MAVARRETDCGALCVERTSFDLRVYAEFLNTLDVVGFVELGRYRQDCRNERLEASGFVTREYASNGGPSSPQRESLIAQPQSN